MKKAPKNWGQLILEAVIAQSLVELTLTADGKKPITIPARLIVEKHPEAGVTTFNENGVTYLQDFHTTKQTLILSGTPSAPK
jgi:hypothetical protein